MNDLLKFISNSLKPFGYHVRKYKAPNILSIANLNTAQNTGNIKAVQRTMGTPFWSDDANTDHMVIYVRTCLRSNRNVDLSKRVTDTSLEESTLRCLRSLVLSINHALSEDKSRSAEVIVMDDISDEGSLKLITAEMDALTCSFTVQTTATTGQGASLHEQFSHGRTQNAIVYFVEDDYLHETNAIQTLWDFYGDTADKLGTHSVLYPQEHPVLYDDHYPSYVVLGRDRHWRSIRHATHTFLTHGHVVDLFWDYFENTKYVGIKKKRKLGSEARTTNKLFTHIPGFSPLKPAAVHLQFEATLPPLYDWKPLWNSMKR
jgi:hypothetical protein